MNTPPIDCHVHFVGNGGSGSGCWLRLGATWWQKSLAAYMLRHIGLRGLSLDAPEFDERYTAHLLGERLLHGSDFPVPCNGLWAALRGFIPFADYRRCRRIANVLERDYQLKLAMGFGEEHFTRVRSLPRLPEK